MEKYLSADLALKCFQRLAGRERTSKKHLERTSAVLYFLSYDAACKSLNTEVLDFTPKTLQGSRHRKQFELEFVRLAVLQRSPNKLNHVTEFGKIALNGKSPESRISSNFLSTIVKRAANKTSVSEYPGRPNAPIFIMGKAATGSAWGIARHQDWKKNLPKILAEFRSSTPNTDLALFALRSIPATGNPKSIPSFIEEASNGKFTKGMCLYLLDKSKSENVLANHIDISFTDRYKSIVEGAKGLAPEKPDYRSMSKSDLIRRIGVLEGILREHDINT